MTVKYLIGDVRQVLATLEPGSVDLVLGSPPFLALRSYLPADHPDKQHEIGGEATPGEFIDTLLDVVEACERVLAPHGSLVFELGDTYAGSGGAGGDYNANGLRDGQDKFIGSARRGTTDAWPLDKSLCLIPEIFRFSLVYGFNPLTGRQTDRWRIRNIVRWVRPNPPVGALGDKFRPATSELIVACKARDRYFDLDAVREPHKYPETTDPEQAWQRRAVLNRGNPGYHTGGDDRVAVANPAGAPPLDWWPIPTAPYKGSHYATWPPALCVRPILSMCPERVCATCGKASRRIVEQTNSDYAQARKQIDAQFQRAALGANSGHTRNNPAGILLGNGVVRPEYTTLGWTDCLHNTWRPGHVLDPFAGSATTLAVAHGHGRDATGIDLDPRNAELAYGRLGLFLNVHDMREQVA